MNRSISEIDNGFSVNLKTGIWLLGIASWLFGITDRTIASFADGSISAIDLMQLFTASFFFTGWLYLRPNRPIRVTKAS
ncbi:MAG: hypothetical protein JOZ78_26930 [Chroococcidiopsidaceae cyanobacterium CP_BM_ER_R8_30]|nr:hypothetical protein [Chroococcidiopsidaceae cyanobacterium CP_BM_ER_R8_30]